MEHETFKSLTFLGILALDHPDWTIPWAGLGAFLLGAGSVLSGLAAIMAVRKGRDETNKQDNGSSDQRLGDGNGSGISDSSSDS